MLKTKSEYKLPTKPVECVTIIPASMGGGVCLEMVIDGKTERAIFADEMTMVNYLTQIIVNPIRLQEAAKAAAESKMAEAPEAKAPAKGNRGRRKMTEAEKEARRAKMEARKRARANGAADVPVEEVKQAA